MIGQNISNPKLLQPNTTSTWKVLMIKKPVCDSDMPLWHWSNTLSKPMKNLAHFTNVVSENEGFWIFSVVDLKVI